MPMLPWRLSAMQGQQRTASGGQGVWSSDAWRKSSTGKAVNTVNTVKIVNIVIIVNIVKIVKIVNTVPLGSGLRA